MKKLVLLFALSIFTISTTYSQEGTSESTLSILQKKVDSLSKVTRQLRAKITANANEIKAMESWRQAAGQKIEERVTFDERIQIRVDTTIRNYDNNFLSLKSMVGHKVGKTTFWLIILFIGSALGLLFIWKLNNHKKLKELSEKVEVLEVDPSKAPAASRKNTAAQ